MEYKNLYKFQKNNTRTRWVSPENIKGEKGKGGMSNKGAKGNAFLHIQPGEKATIFNIQGAGIIHRMWMTGSVAEIQELRRMLTIEMFWDNASTPAVSAPIGDFFGMGLGLQRAFENQLFCQAEGRSFISYIPMPFKTSARIELTNESSHTLMFYYDINFSLVDKLPEDTLYFHTYWNREIATTLGEDYILLPKIKGKGRYLGMNMGVIGNPIYKDTWFGEGEVKIYLDGDEEYPTLVGTGTEDYIGTGWGQGEFVNRYHGALLTDDKNDLYAFYRYHIVDPVYFHDDIKITIQQIGNCTVSMFKELQKKTDKVILVWTYSAENAEEHPALWNNPKIQRLLSTDTHQIPEHGMCNFYRSDDVSATVYFYLDAPSNSLPELPNVDVRLQRLEKEVFSKVNISNKGTFFNDEKN